MKPRVVKHGTYAGWNWHRRNKIPTCVECKEAARQYAQRNRADPESGQRRRDRLMRKAGSRAQTRLRMAHADEYRRYYDEELASLYSELRQP